MRIQPTLLLVTTIAASHAASAQQWEAIAGYDTSDIETDDSVYSLSLERFFKPLDASSRFPLDEIAFGERIASASVFASYNSTDPQIQFFGPEPDSYSSEGSGKSADFGGRYIHRSAGSPHAFQVSARYDRGDQSLQSSTSNDLIQTKNFQELDQDNFVLTAGYDYYLSDLWTLGLSVEREALTADSASSLELSIVNRPTTRSSSTSRYEAKTYHLKVSTDRLWDLGKDRWLGVNLGVEYTELDATQWSNIVLPSNGSTQAPGGPGTAEQRIAISGNTWNYRVEGRYYFNRRTSLSAGFDLAENSDSQVWSLGATHYLTEAFFVRLEGTRVEFNLPNTIDYNDTIDSLSFRLGSRF